MNSADYNNFSDLITVHLRTIDHLNLKLLIFFRHTVSLRFEFQVSDLGN